MYNTKRVAPCILLPCCCHPSKSRPLLLYSVISSLHVEVMSRHTQVQRHRQVYIMHVVAMYI